MRIRELFVSDVTRDIPPVVYFHEQSPDKLAAEVSEYIITGGWPEAHPNHRRVPSGIHEQYVHLLTQISAELARPGGPDLPNAWISGFYGSGKSSFAKLLGLALDGVTLPDGRPLSEAWLDRDTSPKAGALRQAWEALRRQIEPLAVVFDVGSVARDDEHIHSVAVRQLQRRLGYCVEQPWVADAELRLERDGEWARFEAKAEALLGEPWAEVKDRPFAEEDFSLVMSALYPERYPDPMAWFSSRIGTQRRAESPEDAVAAIRDMVKHRRPDATVFFVVDEVSQYVVGRRERVDRLRAFATALGASLKGRAWLLALGQQKLDEETSEGREAFLLWARDRFPQKLQIHLAATNIRDVVHKRLLQKRPEHEATLRALFERHRPDLKTFAYGCEAITPDEFVEVYPLLPGQIDLILQITSSLRRRSTRAQGDAQAIRGLLQLLGELFRSQRLAELEVGALVTLEQIYEVQHTALDADTQESMARVLAWSAGQPDGAQLVRVAKAVALLELIQETVPTDAALVAKCLYERLDTGNQVGAITEALESLRRQNLLGYSEREGYKIQSSAAEEWERERRDIGVPREQIATQLQEGLKYLVGRAAPGRYKDRPFPWAARLSDGRGLADVSLVSAREEACIKLDLRALSREESAEGEWLRRSVESSFADALLWVAGPLDEVEQLAREQARSTAMIRRYEARQATLAAARKHLLLSEKSRQEELEKRLQGAIEAAFLAGQLYFRGRSFSPREKPSFGAALQEVAGKVLGELYLHFVPIQIQPGELDVLLSPEIAGPSTKLVDLGILAADAGHHVFTCTGLIPRQLQAEVAQQPGISGEDLTKRFGGPPYGYAMSVVKACVVGLLRAGQLKVQPEQGDDPLTSIREAGVREVFTRDRDFRKAALFPAGVGEVGPKDRARIARFFKDRLSLDIGRENDAIADAVAAHFPALAKRLRAVESRLGRLPGRPALPEVLTRLGEALEDCLGRVRKTLPTVLAVKRHLDPLQDGVSRLNLTDAELTEEALVALTEAARALGLAEQLKVFGVQGSDIEDAASRIKAHLSAERPWLALDALTEERLALTAAYRTERERLLAALSQRADEARARIKSRAGFATLSADESHQVLRPLTRALPNTSADADSPPLDFLSQRVRAALEQAEDEANAALDERLREPPPPPKRAGEAPTSAPPKPAVYVQTIALHLKNRELCSPADLDALLAELRARLSEPLNAGHRVRLV